ncbi:MAG: DUF1080 domain-containing protein [Kiritimatiellae bacterium]|nr:DUF1080 domain-containing protein [Kiritimatiellia bacterium]
MAETNFEQAPKEPEAMESLFNGKDLSGWDGDTTLWSVKDGVIRGETTPEIKAKGNTFLICTKEGLADFDLRLTYRLNAANNSGIQYRSQRFENGGNKWIVRGYQHEIRNEVNFPNVSGFIYSEGSIAGKGRLCLCGEKAVRAADGTKSVTETLITNDEYKKLFNLDGWNDVVIVAKGNRMKHYLNGRLILDYTDNSPLALKEGIIALQLHAGKPMWTEYKNVRIKGL